MKFPSLSALLLSYQFTNSIFSLENVQAFQLSSTLSSSSSSSSLSLSASNTLSSRTTTQTSLMKRTSFLPSLQRNNHSNKNNNHHHNRKSSKSKSKSKTSLSMIFERMSEESIGALVTAQNESARLGQPTVGTEIMTAGIIDRPENARKTLKKYGVTLRKTKRTVEDMFQPNYEGVEDGENSNSNNEMKRLGRMFNMNKKARDVELPFTPALKRVLNSAGMIADKMESANGGSSVIKSEHILLALFEWEENMPNESNAKLDTDGYAKGAFAVFL
mmetsp:Transcript_13919/g.16910  ORF Transcript_13919/g.16910 Transcript_13919/m.16910 type:complete len:274 (+) Transcript_13919:119-940(+)